MKFRTDWRKVRKDLFEWYKRQGYLALANNNLRQATYFYQMMKVSTELDRIEFKPRPAKKPFGVSEKMDGIVYGIFVWTCLIKLMIGIFR